MRRFADALIGILLVNSANAESFTYLQGVKDNFNSVNSDELASISYDFNNYLVQNYSKSPVSTFDSYEVNKPRAVSFVFSEISDEIVEAEIRIKARPLDDSKAEGNDFILLGLPDEISFKHIALGIDGGADPYFNFDWQIDSPTVTPPTPPELGFDVTINLNSFNTTEAQNVSILDDINSFRALDIAIRDDSTWDYVELNMTIIPEPSTVAFLGLSTMGLYGYRRRERILGNFGAIDILNYKPESKRSLRWRYKSR